MSDPISALAIIGGLSAALGVGTTAAGLAKGGPKLPKVEAPKGVPPPPPPVAPLPPPPTETAADAGVARERKRQQRRFSVADTMLVSPLGTSTSTPTAGGRSILGG